MALWSRTKINSFVFAAGTALLLATTQSVLAGEVEDGEKLYKREGCQTCHGGNLAGNGSSFPSLLTSVKAKDKAQLKQILTEGKSPMPSYATNEKVMGGIDALYAFIQDRAAAAQAK